MDAKVKESFLEKFEPIEPDLYRVAFLYLRNREDALDCIQDTAFRCFRGFRRLREPMYFKTWATRITINCAKDILRQKQHTVPISDVPESPEPDPDVESVTLERLTLEALLDALNENERAAVALRWGMGYSFSEIAEALNMPVGTAKSLCYRGIEKLRRWYLHE